MKVVKNILSENFNGKYNIYRLGSGEYTCDCLSFLTQKNKTNAKYPFAVCKHITKYLNDKNNKKQQLELILPANEEQVEELKTLGVKVSPNLTFEQAEFIIQKLLEKQGIDRDEYKKKVFSKFLPMRYYGIEFEGGLGVTKGEFQNILKKNGFKSIICGYDHKLYNETWKLGHDRSVRVPHLQNVEIVTPKLIGQEGFEKVKKMLELWESTVFPTPYNPVNTTCGCHIHVDAYGWDYDIIYNLLMIWMKIEIPIIHRMIPPSRRNNYYSKIVEEETIKKIIKEEIPTDRYNSLNVVPLIRQHTVEFRHLNGTTNFEKVQAWVIFALLLVDAVFNGLSHKMISSYPKFNEVMDIVGLKKDAIPTIRKAREFLKTKYSIWKADKTIEKEINFRKLEEEYHWEKYYRKVSLTKWNDALLANSISNLASLYHSEVIKPSSIKKENDLWHVPRRNSYDMQVVKQNGDLLVCDCEAFKLNNNCYHSINVARLLVTFKNLEEGACLC